MVFYNKKMFTNIALELKWVLAKLIIAFYF